MGRGRPRPDVVFISAGRNESTVERVAEIVKAYDPIVEQIHRAYICEVKGGRREQAKGPNRVPRRSLPTIEGAPAGTGQYRPVSAMSRKWLGKTWENPYRNARARSGLTRAEVASRSGIPFYTLRGIEMGRSQPKADQLQRLAAVYELTVDELLGGGSEE